MVSTGSILMGILDLLAGFVLVTAGADSVSLTIYTVPFSVAFYLGVAALVKGVYSIAFAFHGG